MLNEVLTGAGAVGPRGARYDPAQMAHLDSEAHG